MADTSFSKIYKEVEEPTGGIYKRVSVKVDEWLMFRKGEPFVYDDIVRYHRWFNCDNEGEIKKALSQKLWYESNKKGALLEKRGRVYRLIDREVETIDWQQAAQEPLLLKDPFNLARYVKIFRQTMAIIAGSPNSGKTALLLNIILMNMDRFIINFYNSETGPDMLKERFDNFGIEIPNPPPFNTFQRYDNFADVIDPNAISIIDYISYSFDKPGLVKQEINNICQTLKDGFCYAAIQKKRTSKNWKGDKVEHELGYGQESTLERPILYLAMDIGKLKIIKAKSWVDHACNPNGMTWNFKLVKGARFIVEGEDVKQEEIPF